LLVIFIGCGKSTVGKRVADLLEFSFVDADEFHSKQNVEKMSSGKALTDDDRKDWLLVIKLIVI
jgi:carbohydrate kinase (thermoresistant glucokinase family)